MKDKTTESVGKFAIVGFIAFLLLAVGGVISVSQSGVDWVGFGDRAAPDTVGPDAEQVDLSIKLTHALDRGNPAATPVRVYDANMVFIESASTSSGVATFGEAYYEGETIYIQARAAAPASSTFVTYTTPMVPYVVPAPDVNGDAQLKGLNLWEVSTSVATFAVTDQDGVTVSTEATDYVNATDTSLNILVSITADCAFGTPEDFTDMDTDREYLAGVWLVLTSTESQSISNYDHHFYSSSLHYYIFNIPMIVRDSDLGYQTGRTFTIDTGTSTFTASADFDFDLYDICWASSFGDISENSFLDGDSDLNPAANANKVV